MLVKELIKNLLEFDPNMEVKIDIEYTHVEPSSFLVYYKSKEGNLVVKINYKRKYKKEILIIG